MRKIWLVRTEEEFEHVCDDCLREDDDNVCESSPSEQTQDDECDRCGYDQMEHRDA